MFGAGYKAIYFWQMIKKVSIIILLLLFTFCALAQEKGIVTRVKDGDTYIIKTALKEHTIRLLNIDAPELKQAWGIKAWLNVTNLILNKTVEFKVLKNDRYGRELAMVYVDGERLDYTIVKNGWAWHYINYNKDETLEKFMQVARAQRKGLWNCGVKKVCAPWTFRKYSLKNRIKYCSGCAVIKK